jgi:hypothetical protein
MAKSKVAKPVLLVAAQACINAYQGHHGKTEKIFFHEHWKKNHEVTYYTADDIANTWIVFRGTSGNDGWENNFNYQQVSASTDGSSNKGADRMLVHEGFWNRTVKTVIDEIIAFVRTTNKPVIVTGHSQGGASALITAYHIKKAFPARSVTCVALASPRVGNLQWKRAYRKLRIPTALLCYRNDTVCKVPPPMIPGLKRKKIGMLLYFHVSKVTRLGMSVPYLIFSSLPVIRQILFFFGNPLNHFPENILKALKSKK